MTTEISYELDGKQLQPEELAGKSGHLSIAFTYENKTGKDSFTYVAVDAVGNTSAPATAGLFGLDVTLNNFGIKALMDKE